MGWDVFTTVCCKMLLGRLGYLGITWLPFLQVGGAVHLILGWRLGWGMAKLCDCHEFHENGHSVTFNFMKKRLQTMLWHHNTKVNSHQRWKQTRFRICFHLWCEVTSTINVTELQVSWNSCSVRMSAIDVWFFFRQL